MYKGKDYLLNPYKYFITWITFAIMGYFTFVYLGNTFWKFGNSLYLFGLLGWVIFGFIGAFLYIDLSKE